MMLVQQPVQRTPVVVLVVVVVMVVLVVVTLEVMAAAANVAPFADHTVVGYSVGPGGPAPAEVFDAHAPVEPH